MIERRLYMLQLELVTRVHFSAGYFCSAWGKYRSDWPPSVQVENCVWLECSVLAVSVLCVWALTSNVRHKTSSFLDPRAGDISHYLQLVNIIQGDSEKNTSTRKSRYLRNAWIFFAPTFPSLFTGTLFTGLFNFTPLACKILTRFWDVAIFGVLGCFFRIAL